MRPRGGRGVATLLLAIASGAAAIPTQAAFATEAPEIQTRQGQLSAAFEAKAIAARVAELRLERGKKRRALKSAKRSGNDGEATRLRAEIEGLSKEITDLEGNSARLRKSAGLLGPRP